MRVYALLDDNSLSSCADGGAGQLTSLFMLFIDNLTKTALYLCTYVSGRPSHCASAQRHRESVPSDAP